MRTASKEVFVITAAAAKSHRDRVFELCMHGNTGSMRRAAAQVLDCGSDDRKVGIDGGGAFLARVLSSAFPGAGRSVALVQHREEVYIDAAADSRKYYQHVFRVRATFMLSRSVDRSCCRAHSRESKAA